MQNKSLKVFNTMYFKCTYYFKNSQFLHTVQFMYINLNYLNHIHQLFINRKTLCFDKHIGIFTAVTNETAHSFSTEERLYWSLKSSINVWWTTTTEVGGEKLRATIYASATIHLIWSFNVTLLEHFCRVQGFSCVLSIEQDIN